MCYESLQRRRCKAGWDEPCKSRGLRTVLWAAGGEIPPADPAMWKRGQGPDSKTPSHVGGGQQIRWTYATAPLYSTS